MDRINASPGTKRSNVMDKKKKNPHAVALGKKGGEKGGPARAKALTADERKAIAKSGGEASKKNKSK